MLCLRFSSSMNYDENDDDIDELINQFIIILRITYYYYDGERE